MEQSTSFVYSLDQQASQSQWLKELLSSTNTSQFVSHLLENQFYKNLNQLLKDSPTIELEELQKQIISFSQSDCNINELVVSLYAVFVKENCVGPSIYTEYVEETKKPLIKEGPLPDNELDPLSFKNDILQQKLIKHFDKDGELIYHKTQFLVLFYTLQILLTTENIASQLKDSKLWQARFYFLYDQQLTSSVVHLKDSSITLYEEFISQVRNDLEATPEGKKQLASLLVEQNYCYLNFYKYKEAKKCIKDATKLVGLSMKLTGRLGRRTKYQEFDIAQLVLDVENREVIIKKVDEKADGENEEKKEETSSQKLLLEEDTILYEEPKVTDILGDIQKKELSAEDQLIIQAYVNLIMKSYPNDETKQELLRPYILHSIEKSNNWLIFSKGLLLRSRNEFERSKLKERSLLQIQTLIDQFRDKEPALGVRLAYFPASNYPLKWQLQKELAKLYMSMGVFISAYELLREVELFEDCILCLFMGGRKTQAEDLANEQLQKTKSPQILCLLGDIKKDVKYYYKAWEESGHKFARAMRSIGRQHFYTGEYRKCIESYEIALGINKLYPDAWFTLGCAYMRIEDWKGAVYSFGVAVSIDDHNYEGWCNISSCYMRMDKEKEAVLCIEQALKQNRKNWKIWENYIIFSLDTNNFHKALNGVRELMRQDKVERVNITLLKKISEVFLKNYASDDIPQNEFLIHKKQLYTFFDEYTEKVAKDAPTYNLIGQVKRVLMENFAVVKEYKLKEVRSIMVIGWENEIETCEKTEICLKELIELYDGKEIPSEEKVFIRNTVQAIEDCLKRKSTVQLN